MPEPASRPKGGKRAWASSVRHGVSMRRQTVYEETIRDTSGAGFRDSGPEASVSLFARGPALAVSKCVHITGHMLAHWAKVGLQPCNPPTLWVARRRKCRNPSRRHLLRTSWAAAESGCGNLAFIGPIPGLNQRSGIRMHVMVRVFPSVAPTSVILGPRNRRLGMYRNSALRLGALVSFLSRCSSLVLDAKYCLTTTRLKWRKVENLGGRGGPTKVLMRAGFRLCRRFSLDPSPRH
ncbi:hypothetical protein BKA63DRAFT_41118 [Paraphoma chrysanthemicola]|nr:hypothetical protein BKA63DRAFT_41118 [Paraphoma chrysanthemicola]